MTITVHAKVQCDKLEDGGYEATVVRIVLGEEVRHCRFGTTRKATAMEAINASLELARSELAFAPAGEIFDLAVDAEWVE